MPYKDPAKQKARSRAYYLAHREEAIERERLKRAAEGPEVAAKRRERYATDPEHRAKILGRMAASRARDPEGHRARTQAWRDSKPNWRGEHRASERRRRYASLGVTEAWYDAKLAEQGGGCAICGTTDPGQGREAFALDHNHVTGEPRGLLCLKCNRALGLLGDDFENLIAAARYLLRYA